MVILSTTQKPNSRAAQKQADFQEAERAKRLMQNGVITPEIRDRALSGAKSVLNESLDDKSGFNPESINYKQGEGFNAAEKPVATPQETPGVIEQSRNARLEKNKATPEQITQNKNNLKGVADADYNVTPSQRSTAKRLENSLANNPVNQEFNRREQEKADELASLRVTKTVTTTDENGVVTASEVEDPVATKAARDAAAAKQRVEDAENQRIADEQNANRKPPSPGIDAFIASLPPEEQEQARQYLGPIEDYYDSIQATADDFYGEGMAAEQDGEGEILAWQNKAEAKLDFFANMWKSIQDKSLQGKLDAAQKQKEADEQELKYQQAKKEAELDQAIRRQMMQNEKNRKDQMLGLGISGGWRSTRISADTIFALGRGEEIVADLRVEKSLSTDYFTTKGFQIEATYHSAVNGAYDTYEQNGFEAMQKFADRADTIENTVYTRKKDKTAAIREMENDWFKFMAENGENKLKMITDAQKYMIDNVNDARKQEYLQRKDLYDDALSYVDRFGTQNKAAISEFERQLDLAPGTLSNQKTLAELRMNKSGGSGGGIGGGNSAIGDFVTKKRTQILRANPDFDGKTLDSALLESVQTNFSGAKNAQFRRDIEDYVNNNNFVSNEGTGGEFVWLGEGSTYVPHQQYYVNYKFRPSFEQNVYTIDDNTVENLNDL